MRNAGGYVRVFRSMLDWEWYDDTACVRLMLHLLLTANWEEKQWHGQTIYPGQLVTSMDRLAETLGTTRSAIRRTLDKLKSSGEVTIQTNNHWTTLTLGNWAEYQEVQPTNGRPSGRPTTNKRPTTDRPPATTKEGETLKKESIEEINLSFDTWWDLYQRKGSRKLSEDVWAKMSEEDRVACIASTPKYVKSKPEKVYRKDGERFLKHRTWEDEVITHQPVLNIGGGMTKEEAEEEMLQIRIKHGRDPILGFVGDEECSRELLIYRGRIKRA
jgi:hypothetical protein